MVHIVARVLMAVGAAGLLLGACAAVAAVTELRRAGRGPAHPLFPYDLWRDYAVCTREEQGREGPWRRVYFAASLIGLGSLFAGIALMCGR